MDNAFWQAIREDDYSVPAGFSVEQLSQELLMLLGSTDPMQRDYFAYGILERWIVREYYSRAQLRAMLWGLVGNLSKGLGTRENDTVFLRSFSMLVMAEILKYDNAHPFLDVTEVQEVFDRTLEYLGSEQDLRGYVPGKGWAHALAHVGDLLGVLACNRFMERKELEKMLSALAEKITTPVEYVYVTVEDERLALIVIMALTRNLLEASFWDWWCVQLTMPVEKMNWEDTIHFAAPMDICAYHNTKAFLHALYFQLTLAQYTIPGVNELIAKIIEALYELDPGFYAAEVVKILNPEMNIDDLRE